jgi:hypothetical protein
LYEIRREKKLDLLGAIGQAQEVMSVDTVLNIKRAMFGAKPSLNNLSIKQLNQLIIKLRSVYANRQKRKKVS